MSDFSNIWIMFSAPYNYYINGIEVCELFWLKSHLFPGWGSLRFQGRWEGLLQDKNYHWGHVGLEESRVGIFGPANICPSALCQNMLEVHLDPCPRVSALSGSCACLHDNSRNCVNCCALSQMLLCTCGLIRWHLPPPHKRVQKFCMVSMSKMCSWYNRSWRSHAAKH